MLYRWANQAGEYPLLVSRGGSRGFPPLSHAGWIPILFSLGDVSTDVFQSVTPKAGFEPATSRLTVGGSATELLGIALFSLKFEIQCIVSITHFPKNFMVFSKTKILSVCTCSFHLTNKKKDFNWFHSASREEALSRIWTNDLRFTKALLYHWAIRARRPR